MMDDISSKIMTELWRDGRLTNIELAKRLGISPFIVAKKKKQLIDNRDLVMSVTAIPSKLGYMVGAYFGLGVELKKIESVFAVLSNKANISLVVTCYGRFDIIIASYFFDSIALQNFVKTELQIIDGINHIETYLIADPMRQHWDMNIKESMWNKPVKLDETDKKIIKELIENKNVKHNGIAKKLGMNQSSISRRIAVLAEQGVIYFRALPSPIKWGYNGNALILMRVELAKVDKICSELAGFPEVVLTIRLMNDFEIIFGIQTEDLEKLDNFIKTKVANIDGIIKIETFILGVLHYFRSASPV
jgi:DNA-binding Lrp family transcriptional regulator